MNRLAALAALMLSIGCSRTSPSERPSPEPGDEAARSIARVSVWDASCAPCHAEPPEVSAEAALEAVAAGTKSAPWHVFAVLGEETMRHVVETSFGVLDDDLATPIPESLALSIDARIEDAVTRADPERGRELNDANCSACHGVEGRGNGPAAPALVPAPRDWAADASTWRVSPHPLDILHTVSTGIEGTAMASYSNLSLDERAALVAYITTNVRGGAPAGTAKTSKQERRRVFAPYIPSADVEQVTNASAWARQTIEARAEITSPARGEGLYASSCAPCHGAEGEGVAGMFPPLRATRWTHGAGSGLAHVEVVLDGMKGEVVVSGVTYNGVMQPWHGVLDDGKVAAIVNYVNTSWGNAGEVVSSDDVAAVRRRLDHMSFSVGGDVPVVLDDAGRDQLTVACAGCHGGSAPSLEHSTKSITTGALARVLASPQSEHPRLGMHMRPVVFAELAALLAADASSVDAQRAHLDALSGTNPGPR